MNMMTKCNVLCEDKTSISNYAKSWVTYSPSKTQQFNWLVGWLVGLIDKNREKKMQTMTFSPGSSSTLFFLRPLTEYFIENQES